MLKQLTACIFLLAFMATTFDRAVIIADYYTNTAAFAKNCINKARPMMHCNGKCQMMKKLQEEEKKEQQNSERKGENRLEVISLQYDSPAFIPSYVASVKSYPPYKAGKLPSVSFPCFHPPQV